MLAWLCGGIGGLLSLAALVGAWVAARRRRLIDDLPTVTTAGAFIGQIEIIARAEAGVGGPLRGCFSGQPVVWQRWTISEHYRRTRTVTRRVGNRTVTSTETYSGWEEIASGGEGTVCRLVDDEGEVQLDPQGATVVPQLSYDDELADTDPRYVAWGGSGAISGSTGHRRMVEESIAVGTPLYVLGFARERSDAVAIEIAADPRQEAFFISTAGERAAASSARWTQIGWLLLALLIAGAAAGLGAKTVAASPAVPVAVAAGGVLLLWAAGWLYTAYASLVRLRNRLLQAISNVDVQLARRAQLIPELVRVVEALARHERDTQTALARLRSAVTGAGPVAAAVRLVVEGYPALVADGASADLMRALADTETRLARARGYATALAAQVATRQQIVPDRWCAAWAGLREPVRIPTW